MPYTAVLTDDQAVKGYTYPVEVKLYSNGTQVVPTSATITVYDPDGTAQVSDAAMSVAVAGTMTYSLAASYLDTLWENARLEIDFVVSTVHYKLFFFFDCVLMALTCAVTDDDLKKYVPALAAEIWSVQSTYSAQIDEAFRYVKRGIKDKGKRPAMLLDGGQVRELVILRALEMIFFDFARSTEDIWWARYLEHKAKLETAWASLKILYDEDEDATIDETEKVSLGGISFSR